MREGLAHCKYDNIKFIIGQSLMDQDCYDQKLYKSPLYDWDHKCVQEEFA